jgi:16S rRNA (uracil1498-N3)-methyltransferase
VWRKSGRKRTGWQYYPDMRGEKTMPKFFINKNEISRGQVRLLGEDEKHIKTVLRAREGEEVTLCDGEGMDYLCRIASLERGVLLDVLSKTPCETEPEIRLTLYQGLPKADKMEWIIQKCVEIGIDRIVPVATERAIVKLDKKEGKKLERWQKIAEAAAKQSGRGKIPEVSQRVLKFAEAVEEAARLSGAVIPYEKEPPENGLRQFASGFSGTTAGIFIGPEGGFSEEEVALAQEKGIRSVSLGKRILRTETAGMVTAAILLYEWE